MELIGGEAFNNPKLLFSIAFREVYFLNSGFEYQSSAIEL